MGLSRRRKSARRAFIQAIGDKGGKVRREAREDD